MSPNPLRNIPSVSELLENPSLRSLVDRINHSTLAANARAVLDELRSEMQTVASERTLPDVSELAERIARRIMENGSPRMRSVVNATGILLHPELGRPPLAEAAIEAMIAAARGFVDETHCLVGENRACRKKFIEQLLRTLTGAERAIVTGNVAGATALTLAALSGDKEVIVSRGQIVDFGGEYRLQDMASVAGAKLCEVGASNLTRVDDFSQAIGEKTAAMLSVECERFGMVGYVGSPSLKEIAGIAHSNKIPLVAHLDAGSMIDVSAFGISGTTTVAAAVADGADVVIFRGDRLLGGPQCGVIAGKRGLIERIERHALAAACRVDGPIVAALAATLQLYSDPEKAKNSIPLLQLLSTSAENLKNRAERLAPQLAAVSAIESAEVAPGTTHLGGYGFGATEIPTWQIKIKPKEMPIEQLVAKLEKSEPVVLAQTADGQLVLDLRSVAPWQDMELLTAFESLVEDK